VIFFIRLLLILIPRSKSSKKSLTEVLDFILLNAVLEGFRYTVVVSNLNPNYETKLFIDVNY